MVTLEDVLELVADQAVEPFHVVGTDTFAIGGICYQYAPFGRFLPFRQGAGVQLDHAADARAADILGGDVNRAGRHVGADDFVGYLALFRIVVIEAVKQLRVEVLPVLEGEMAAVDTGIYVGGNQRGLDQECAGAAHRVNQGAVAAPAAFENDAGGEHLVNRGLGLRDAVAALVERLARRVERQRHLVAGDMDVDHHVGVLKAHARALVVAVAVLEPVDNRVLDAVGDEARVGELVAEGDGVNRERRPDGHERAPVELLGAVIQLVGVDGCELENRFEDAQGGAAAQVGFVEHLQVPLEGDHASPRFYVFCSEVAELFGQHVFQSLEGFGYHFKFVGHHLYMLYGVGCFVSCRRDELSELPHRCPYQDHGYYCREYVAYVEGTPHPVDAHAARKPQQQRDEENHLAYQAEEYRQADFAGRLEISCRDNLESHDPEEEHRRSEGVPREVGQVPVGDKGAGNVFRNRHSSEPAEECYHRPGPYREPERAAHAPGVSGPVVVADDRLHPLAYAEHDAAEHRRICDEDSRGGDGVDSAVAEQGVVEQDVDHAGGDVDDERGGSDSDHSPHDCAVKPVNPPTEGHRAV